METTDEVLRNYSSLENVLKMALNQASMGKGKDRHADGNKFEQQPICSLRRMVGSGFTKGQAIKKIIESDRLSRPAAVQELLGAINYLAAEIICLENEQAKAMAAQANYVIPGCATPAMEPSAFSE